MAKSAALRTSDDTSFSAPTWTDPQPKSSLSMDDDIRRMRVRLGSGEVEVTVKGPGYPTWLESSIDGLNRASALPTNWDSYGSRPVNQRTLEHALLVLTKFMRDDVPAPEVFASSHGGIQFLWNKPERELKISVNAPFSGDYYYSDERTGKEVEDQYSLDFDRLAVLLGEYAA